MLQADPLISTVLASFFSSVQSSPFWLPPPLWNLLHPPAFFYLHFLLHHHHPLRPSLRSFCCSTDTQPILPQRQRRKSHFPNFPKVCHALMRLSLLLLSFSFLPFFSILNVHRLMMNRLVASVFKGTPWLLPSESPWVVSLAVSVFFSLPRGSFFQAPLIQIHKLASSSIGNRS